VRILVLDTYYPAFLASHYAERPDLADAQYDVQWRALMDRFFGTSDGYSHYLGELNHEAHEVVVNAEPLQRAWAREHGARLERRFRWPGHSSLVLEQAEEFEPDVVYVQDLNAFSPRTLRALRARSRLLVGQIASAIPSRRKLVQYDLLTTSFPHFVEMFRTEGIASEYFRIGFDPRVLEHVPDEAPPDGVVFVGGLSRGPHGKGNELFERAAQRVAVDFWGYGADRWPQDSAIRRRFRGEAWGLDMYRVLRRAKIALNRHIDIAEDHANNMRLYEATGVGTLLITDAKSDLSNLFEPGTEVITYSTEDELVEKIEHYLEDEAERARIGRAGQERTLRDHTYGVRMRELIDILARYVR
jgi:spore maturation protein CgeB